MTPFTVSSGAEARTERLPLLSAHVEKRFPGRGRRAAAVPGAVSGRVFFRRLFEPQGKIFQPCSVQSGTESPFDDKMARGSVSRYSGHMARQSLGADVLPHFCFSMSSFGAARG